MYASSPSVVTLLCGRQHLRAVGARKVEDLAPIEAYDLATLGLDLDTLGLDLTTQYQRIAQEISNAK